MVERARAQENATELAAAEASKRPVFVYPDLLEKDPLLAVRGSAPLPDSLLFRLWPRGTDPSLERDALLASARAILERRGCATGASEGCLPPPAEPPRIAPTEEMQLVLAYEAAAFEPRTRGPQRDPGSARRARRRAPSLVLGPTARTPRP